MLHTKYVKCCTLFLSPKFILSKLDNIQFNTFNIKSKFPLRKIVEFVEEYLHEIQISIF